MQVIPQTPGVAGSSPVLRLQSYNWQGSSQHNQAAGLEGSVQHLVPWVPAIIQGIKPAEFIIVIAPPAGLLELGQRQQLAQQLGAAPGPSFLLSAFTLALFTVPAVCFKLLCSCSA